MESKEIFEIDAFQIRTVFDVLKDILTQCIFIFQEQSMSIANVDPEKIIYVKCNLNASVSSVRQTPFKFVTYAQTIYKMFRSCVQGQECLFELQRETSSLILTVNKKGFNMTSKLKSLPIEPSKFLFCPPQIIKSEKFATANLHKIMYTMSSVSRIIQIEWTPTCIKFSADDNIQSSVLINHDISVNDTNINAKVLIVVKYLEKFCNKHLSSSMWLGIGEENQIIAAYDLPNGDLCLTMASLE